jgi:hypothetical protein
MLRTIFVARICYNTVLGKIKKLHEEFKYFLRAFRAWIAELTERPYRRGAEGAETGRSATLNGISGSEI